LLVTGDWRTGCEVEVDKVGLPSLRIRRVKTLRIGRDHLAADQDLRAHAAAAAGHLPTKADIDRTVN
jgi:hypothetical protein